MKNAIILILVTSILISCQKENKDCNCKDVKGMYYHNINKAFIESGGTSVEDYEFSNGNITIHRATKDKLETFKNVARYKVLDNCVIKIYALDRNAYKPLKIDTYYFQIGAIVEMYHKKLESVSEPMINYNCEGFKLRAIQMLKFNPRK